MWYRAGAVDNYLSGQKTFCDMKVHYHFHKNLSLNPLV